MQQRKPFYLSTGMAICNFLSYTLAGGHYCLLFTGLLKVPEYLLPVSEGRVQYLRTIWHARMVKRMASVLVRTPLRYSSLRLVNFNIPLPADTGCIIVICHTPWKRLLVQWCLQHHFATIISSINLTHGEKLNQIRGSGVTELRDIVKYLQLKGRLVIAADVFNDAGNCPVNFLGKNQNASLLPARLAALAAVPLIVAIPTLHNGTVHFINGPQFDVTLNKNNSCTTIQDIISFLDAEIRKSPSIWPSYVA
jgi:hypothetical protein